MKRFLSILLCLILVMSVFSVGFAEPGDPVDGDPPVTDPGDPPPADPGDPPPEDPGDPPPEDPLPEVEGARCCPTPGTVTLTVQKEGQGWVDPSVGDHEVATGSTVTLRARPAECWEFLKWYDVTNQRVLSRDPVTRITVDCDRTVKAYFVPKKDPQLTVDHEGRGSTKPSGTDTVSCGSVIPLSASPDDCWEFSHWDGPVANSTHASTSVKVTEDTHVTAVFVPKRVYLTVETNGPGDASPEGQMMEYECGTSATILAIPYPCAEFTGWSGDVPPVRGGPIESITVIMDRNRTIIANFRMKMYPLTLTAGEGGSVEPDSGDYQCGTTVGVVAIPDKCYEFVGWRGDVEDPKSPRTEVYMDGPKVAHAMFRPIEYELNVTHEGQGYTVPSGASMELCGQSIPLQAVPARCWKFVRWEGPVASSGSATTTVMMNDDTHVHAVFEQIEYDLFVGHHGEGMTTPSGASTRLCGERVDLVARPAPCWEFTGWEGPVASPGSASTYVMMYDDTRVYAHFDMIQYNLGISHEGNGTVTPPDGVYTHTCGSVVKLYAEADECWKFDHWVGDVASTGSAMTTVTMDESKRVKAVFVRCCSERYTLNVYVHEGQGTTVPSGSSVHLAGTTVDLLAIPDEGWHFVTWRGGPVNSWTTEESSVDIVKDTTVAAIFAPNEYTLTVTHEGDGETIPSGASARAMGEVVELTANPDSGWYFDRWEGPVADMYDPTTTVEIEGDTEVHAIFLPEMQYRLRINIEGNGDTDPSEGDHYYPVSSEPTVVDLDVDPDSGWYFSRWEGPDASDIDGDDITMDSDKEITAVFRRRSSPGPFIIIRPTLTISIEGDGTVDPFVGSRSYNTGEVVDLTATPTGDAEFVGWFGPDGGDVSGDQITMNESKNIIARFETPTPPPPPPVEPPEIEIPLTETPLGGGELPNTGQALPFMNYILGLCLIGIGSLSKKNRL